MTRSWKINEHYVVPQAITDTGTTQNLELGTRIKAHDTSSDNYGEATFIYALGVASTAAGDICAINDDYSTTRAVASGVYKLMGIAMSANVASQYGWYLITGREQGNVATSFADNAQCFLTSTAGRINSTSVDGDYIFGMKGASAESGNLAILELVEPNTTAGAQADFASIQITNLDIGASGTAGSIDVFPTTASKGKFTLACDDQTGNTAVTLKPNAMGQATTVNIADPGAAASYVVQSTAALSLAEADVLKSVTAGTATASKAVVLDASKDIATINALTATTGTIATVNATNIDAGASGTAGSVDVFPTTASKGKLTLACTDQTGNTAVTLNANAMGQATTVNIADPGAAASYVVQSTTALTLAEADVLKSVTPGTAAASKAVVLDASKDIATINALTATTGTIATVNATNIDAGASGTAGSVDVFPTTASRGKLTLACTDQTGNTAVTLNANAMGQATTVNIADPGAAASYVAQSTAALTLAEMDVLDGATAGTQVASKVIVTDANINQGIAKATELHIGATGAEVQLTATPAEINAKCDKSSPTVTVTDATVSITSATHAEKLVLLDRAAGIAVTLPAATGTADTYRFLIVTTITSNTTTIKVADGTDSYHGIALGVDTDGEGATGLTWYAVANDDTLTFDGTTTGGKVGDYIELFDYATDHWLIKTCHIHQSGVDATPFSATV